MKEHSNADGLSRLPLPQNEKSNVRIGVDVFNVAQIDSLPVTAARLGQATRRDRVLGKVWRYTVWLATRMPSSSTAVLDEEA